jgi:hypothetical protein
MGNHHWETRKAGLATLPDLVSAAFNEWFTLLIPARRTGCFTAQAPGCCQVFDRSEGGGMPESRPAAVRP